MHSRHMAFTQSPSFSNNPKILNNYLTITAHCNDCLKRPDNANDENKEAVGAFEGHSVKEHCNERNLGKRERWIT